MIDRLRRWLGRADDDAEGDDSTADRDQSSEQESSGPRAPELAPREVSLRPGLSVTSVALRATLVVVGVLLALALLHQLRELVLIAIVALIIGAAMHAPVVRLERLGLPRPLALLSGYALLIGMVAVAAVIIGGPLAVQAQALFEDLPGLIDDLRGQATAFIDSIAGAGRGEQALAALEDALTQIEIGPLLEYPLQAVGALVNIVLILFLSAFFLLERDRARGWIAPLLPADRRAPAIGLARAVLNSLASFVHGQLLLMTIVGTGMTVALLVLGIPFALPLGLFAFLAEAIPMVGPWLAIIPAVAVALTESPEQAALLLVFWFVIQQIEGYVLTPAVMGKVQHLPPSVVLLSVLAGFQLFGLFGAIIAVPVVAATFMIVEAVLVPARRRALVAQGEGELVGEPGFEPGTGRI